MAYEIAQGPVFPYPLRPSSFVEIPGVLEVSEPLHLDEAEKKELLDFEAKLFEELKEIKGIKINTHEVYPAALAGGKGHVMVEIMYKQGAELRAWVKEVAKQNGVIMGVDKEALDSTENIKEDPTKEIYKAVFDDLFGEDVVGNGEKVQFKKFEQIIKEITGKEVEITRTFEFSDQDSDEADITQIFSEFDLKSIPLEWRRKINMYSEDWVKTKIGENFLECKGDVNKIGDLKRICRLTDPEKDRERLSKLWELKRKIVGEARKLGDGNDDLSKAKTLVSNIYRKYINKQIADDMLLWMGAGENGKEIFSLDAARMERYDKFIHGTGEAFDEAGNRQILTNKIDEIVLEISANKQFEPDSEVMMTSDDEVRIANWIILEYGFPKCKAAKRSSNLGKMGIAFKKDSEIIVYVPKESRKQLPNFLAGIAHKIEGHVLSHRNWGNVDLPLKIMKAYSAGGRDEVLAEAAGKKVEKNTRMAIDGFEDRPEINYYQGMKLRLQGGTFKDCLRLFFETRMKKDEVDMETVLSNDKKFKVIFNYAYSTAMRLFREHTPLDDKSGKLTTTDQLKYLEQETVVKALESHGLEALLFVNGPDLYSLVDLIKLGAFDLEKIQTPKMVVAKKIWPILKDGLARGLTVKEILDEEDAKKEKPTT